MADPSSSDAVRTKPARRAHIVLVGLSGAGKSTVGPFVASRLRRPFVDLDQEIERRERRSVSEIFAEGGERAFRTLERALTSELAREEQAPSVIATGGGWIEDPANRSLFGTRFFSVYLRVSIGEAIARMGAAGPTRPLLGGSDPSASLRELFRRREALYLQAEHMVSTDSMSSDHVADSIVALASAELGD